jgi:hypothetical protein
LSISRWFQTAGFKEYVIFSLFLAVLSSFMSLSQVLYNRFQKNLKPVNIEPRLKYRKGVTLEGRGRKEPKQGLVGQTAGWGPSSVC